MLHFPDAANDTKTGVVLSALDAACPMPQPGFERIAQMAARMLGVSKVWLSLADIDRRRPGRRVGDVQDDASCNHDLEAHAGPLVVPDANQDERFRHHPYVTGMPFIRFYASIPVRTHEGTTIGAIRAFDPAPRELGAGELDTLKDLADLLGREIQYRDRLHLAHDLIQRANLAPKVKNEARTRNLREANRALSSALARQAHTEQALRERQAELDAVIEQAKDAYICIDEQHVITGWNRQAEKMFGWSKDEALGQSMFTLIIPADVAPMIREDMRLFANTGKSHIMDQTIELSGMRKDGQRIIIELQVSRVEVNGRTLFCSFAQDISARKAHEARLAFEALHDTLTALPNRRALLESLPAAQARAQHTGRTMALLFIDLDGFKAVNDSLGHEAGDALLQTVATRLSTSVRTTDRVFRLAGDEFTVILEDVQNGLEDAVRIADKLVAVLSDPVPLGHGIARIGASIGIALQTAGSVSTVQELVNEADGWMYRAKHAGRGRVLPRPAFGTDR